MNIRTFSTTALAWLALAALAQPVLADGVPAPHKSRHASGQTAVRKPNDSGVALQYRVDSAPKVGAAVSVVLQFDGVTAPDGATVSLSADDGLTLSSAASLTLPAGQRTSTTAAVVVKREGLAYLNVFITQAGAMSAISIPIQTGAGVPAMKSGGETKPTAEGDSIITMPAK